MGVSWQWDYYDEVFEGWGFDCIELVFGVFGEYIWIGWEDFMLVVGLWVDYYNFFGVFVMFCFYFRYNFSEMVVLCVIVGCGQCIVNILIEQIGVMVFNWNFIIEGGDFNLFYGLEQEIVWNFGFNYVQEFIWGGWQALLSFDVYYICFQ